MTTKSAPFYWLECDGCGVSSTDGAEHAAWSDKDQARDDAHCADWMFYTYQGEELHLCWDCSPRDEHGDAWEELP